MDKTWTPARIFMTASAVFHVPVGVAGLFYELAFPIGSGAAAAGPHPHVFGVFETNGWHTLGAVFVAGVSLYYALRPRHARAGALALGLGHVGLFVSLVLWDPSTFRIASNAADQVAHASTAIFGTMAGLLTARPEPDVSAAGPPPRARPRTL
ncbi:MAG TPA: DUF4383 domain-containing protein [Actinomycetota bacterium]|nr:DUF4383 domain-containing protein [Actinomycetota bacterium]